MACFLGCFGGEKDHRRRSRRSPQRQRNRVENVQDKSVISEQPIKETVAISEQPTKEKTRIVDLVPELQQTKPEVLEQTRPSPSPKRVTFGSNITTYEHIQIHDSIETLPEYPTNIEKEKDHKHTKTLSQSNSIMSEDNSTKSSVASYPPNHRYHQNTRDSDDEAEEFGDRDLDDEDDDLNGEYDKEDGYDEDDEDTYAKIPIHGIWSEPILTDSGHSRTGKKNPFSQAVDEGDIQNSPIVTGGSKRNARDRRDYINSALNPVENITQWKNVKSKGAHLLRPPQKENLSVANEFELPRVSLSSSPTLTKNTNQSRKNENRKVAVDASLSNWLSSPEVTPPKKKITDFGGFEINVSGKTMSEGRNSVRSFEDRPILGALTVEELRQISITKTPRKSFSKSPDEMPIIGTVGTFWNHSNSENRSDSSSFKGIPNTTSKYREDKRVNWHSTPFETRLDRALLSQGAS